MLKFNKHVCLNVCCKSICVLTHHIFFTKYIHKKKKKNNLDWDFHISNLIAELRDPHTSK